MFFEYQEYYFYGIVKRKIYISTILVGFTAPSFKSIYAKRLHYTENDLFHSILRAPNRYHIVSVICNTYDNTQLHTFCVLIQFPIICSQTRCDTNFVKASSNCDVRRHTNKRPGSTDTFILLFAAADTYTVPRAYYNAHDILFKSWWWLFCYKCIFTMNYFGKLINTWQGHLQIAAIPPTIIIKYTTFYIILCYVWSIQCFK